MSIETLSTLIISTPSPVRVEQDDVFGESGFGRVPVVRPKEETMSGTNSDVVSPPSDDEM